MSQVTSGLRAVLGHAGVYSLLQNLLGARRARRALVSEFIRPRPGQSVLDIGCGPADILEFLPEVRYWGFDLSPAYIATAQRRWGARGTFASRDVNELRLDELPPMDVILAVSLLHHLEDAEARGLFAALAPRLAPGGRLVTIDPCFVDCQNPLAHWLISRDRGRNVRRPEAYEHLAREVFPSVRAVARDNLMNIPYNHTVMVCELAAPAPPPQPTATADRI